jgi:hypothetical protein
MRSVKEVQSFVQRTLRHMPGEIGDFERRQVIKPETMTRNARRLEAFFKPVLDMVQWENVAGMNPAYAKHYRETARVLASHALNNHIRAAGGVRGLALEASIAGVDLPTFTRQLMLTVTRAYAQLFTLQLFGVIPLAGPTGRIVFKDYQYDDSFAGANGTITAGDRVDVISEFDPNFYQINEGARANKLKVHWSSMDISSKDYRIATDWSDAMADDSRNVYGDDIEASMNGIMNQEMTRVVDRLMIASVQTNVPAANSVNFIAQPNGSNGPDYSSLTPSEQKMWDERLWGDGILTVISKMRLTRKENNDGDPDWIVCGTNFALRLSKLSSFVALEKNITEVDLQRGALRDLGQLKSLNIRVLIDPMLTAAAGDSAATTSDIALFGRKPKARGDVGHYWAPYVALQPTRDFYDPVIGSTTKAVRSRFGLVQPNTGLEPNSSQLAEVYGKLVVQ